MCRQQIQRPALAMVELIFSIVVIGITLMSAPMLIRQASNSGYVAIQQEGIGEAATRVNMIVGYEWDEADTRDSYAGTILQTDTNISELNETDIVVDPNGTIRGSGRRQGTPPESYRSYVDTGGDRYKATEPADLGLETTDVGEDDVDDFGAGGLVTIKASDSDYIEKNSIVMATEVAYIDDIPDGGSYNVDEIVYNPNFSEVSTVSTNIKRIKVTLTSTSGVKELNKSIILNAFSCNVGTPALEERTF